MRPAALVIDEDAADRRVAERLFASLGWDAVGAAADDWTAVGGRATPSLVLHAAGGVLPTPSIAVMRAHPAIGETPIVAWIASGTIDAVTADYDDVLDRPATPAGVAALARRWHPDDPSAVLDRLEAAMGTEEIAAMTARLHAQLTAALAALSTSNRPDDAHRIAGIAGMLGFDELGAAWLGVSHGTGGAVGVARIATRRALAALGWRCRRVSCSAARP